MLVLVYTVPTNFFVERTSYEDCFELWVEVDACRGGIFELVNLFRALLVYVP